MRVLVSLLFSSGLLVRAPAADIALTVEDSGSKEVDKLVMQLVSTRPAPHPSGYWDMTTEEVMAVPYMTPEVSNAIVKLKAMGSKIFPALVKHLGDDRYSFSDITAAWDNLDVGAAVMEVLSDGHHMHSGYKGRKTPTGGASYLSFESYVTAKEPEQWATWATNKSRLDIQVDFIDWCIKREQERGFTDAEQKRHVLETYEQARARVRKEYSELDGAANGSQPTRSETNRPSSGAGPRR